MIFDNKDKYYKKSSVPFNIKYRTQANKSKINPIISKSKPTKILVPKNINNVFNKKIKPHKIKDKKINKILKKIDYQKTNYDNIEALGLDDLILDTILQKLNNQ